MTCGIHTRKMAQSCFRPEWIEVGRGQERLVPLEAQCISRSPGQARRLGAVRNFGGAFVFGSRGGRKERFEVKLFDCRRTSSRGRLPRSSTFRDVNRSRLKVVKLHSVGGRLTDAEWLEPLIPKASLGGRPHKTDRRRRDPLAALLTMLDPTCSQATLPPRAS